MRATAFPSASSPAARPPKVSGPTILVVAGLLLALPERVTTIVGVALAAGTHLVAALLGDSARLPLVRRAPVERE